MTTLEILLSILFPGLLVAWAAALLSARMYRHLAEFWRQQYVNSLSANSRRQHPLRECIRRASINRHSIRRFS